MSFNAVDAKDYDYQNNANVLRGKAKVLQSNAKEKNPPDFSSGAPYRTDTSNIQAEFLVVDTSDYIKIPPVHALRFLLTGM